MTSIAEEIRTERPDFIFIGEHPAIDFANTFSTPNGVGTEHLRAWTDVIDWFLLVGLSKDQGLNLPDAGGAEALRSVLELRQAWAAELPRLVAGEKVSDKFLERVNRLLAEDIFHEELEWEEETGYRLVRSGSQLRGEKLALALLARQIAVFLAEANLGYLHRCANTASCVLYFYDTTKNHRRQWCSVASCGNRHKVAQFRKRQGGRGDGK
jgi:predicted RNA-binding Zn ribbon-like protein